MRGWGRSGRSGHYSGPSGPSGKKVRKFEAGDFVGWDGEGACVHGCAPTPDEPCPHAQGYVYLANSKGGELVNPDGIDSRTALAAIAGECHRLGEQATHVCYGLSYDANQILREASRLDLRALWKGQRVRLFRRFKVAYRPRKSLWVKDYRNGTSGTIWDVFGFFQGTFVKAVEDNLGKNDPRLPLIREGKARRGAFKVGDIDAFIRRYTAAELSALVDLCVNLRRSFVGAGLVLRRWDGAGAAASALLEREGIKGHLRSTPEPVHLAALYGYSGGRSETPLYGRYTGTVYHGDLRSAYPWAATLLPSLSDGKWRHTGKNVLPGDTLSVVKVRWDFSRLGYAWDVLPFSFRSSSGAIYFPRKGTNWVWRPEIEAALRFPELRRKIELMDSWSFRPKDDGLRPFGFLTKMYEHRLRLKAIADAAEKAMKLSSNSVYGKIVQNVGGTAEKPPPYHQLEYGGFITSATRARLFLMARSVPGSVITLATDGIYSTAPLDFTADGGTDNRLGSWEPSTHEAILIAQSGVYWYRNAPKKGGDRCDLCGAEVVDGPLGSVRCTDTTVCRWSNLKSHYRGFDEGTLSPDLILGAWQRGERSVTARSTRFVTIGRATLTEGAFESWRKWVVETRDLDIRATGKRVDRRSTGPVRPDRGLVATDPSPLYESVSTPYTLGWEAGDAADESTIAQEEASLR